VAETLAAERKTALKARKKPKADAAPIGDRLLTLREAAEVLRLSTRTVREYISRGEIEGRIIGGRWRFRRADLDAFFADAPRPHQQSSEKNWEHCPTESKESEVCAISVICTRTYLIK